MRRLPHRAENLKLSMVCPWKPNLEPQLDVNNVIVGSNQLFLQALSNALLKVGLKSMIATSSVEGDATKIGENYAQFLLSTSNPTGIGFVGSV